MIHDESLDRFYELRGKVSQPVGSGVFQRSPFNWLGPLVERAEAAGAVGRLSLALEGVSCVGCVWLVDRIFESVDGGVSCRVNVQRGTIDLEWRREKCDVVGFFQRLKEFGYRVCPARSVEQSESRAVAWRLGLCGAFALNGMLFTLPGYLGMERGFAFAAHFGWLTAFFATLSLWFGGSFFIGKAWRAAKRGIAHLDLPISVGILAAYVTSWYGFWRGDENLVYFDFVSTFLFLMLLGRWLQVAALERNRNRLADISLSIPEVDIESNVGDRIRSTATELQRGTRFWLNAGERIPVRSRLLSGRASLAMDWITGESESRLVETPAIVPSGAEVESSFPLPLEALEDWDESLLAKISQSDARSTERDRTAQKWIVRYLVAASALAALCGAGWWLSGSVERGLMVFIAILVVSCPCALGLAWPFADELALARLKRSGVFVTTHSLWNRLAQVRQIVFDKTGTLTRTRLTLMNPQVLAALDETSANALSALCAESRHPVASSIRESLMARGRSREYSNTPHSVIEHVGLGCEMLIEEDLWRLGKEAWAADAGTRSNGAALTCNRNVVARFAFDDCPYPDAVSEISALQESGCAIFILSGDRTDKVARVGELMGLPSRSAIGDLSPEGKREWLLAHDPATTLMVGDGANDLLAFEASLCSGAPANEQGIVADRADFHYVGSGIRGIRNLLEVGRARRKTVRALLVFAIAYNCLAIGLAAAGWVTPLWASVLMPLSSVASLAIVWLGLGLGDASTPIKR